LSDNVRSTFRQVAFVALAMLAAIGLVHGMHHCGTMRARTSPSVTLESKRARFTIYQDGHVRIETKDHARTTLVDLVSDDESAAHIVTLVDLAPDGPSRARATAASFAVDAGEDALDITFAVSAPTTEIGARVPLEGRGVFLSGRGELGDLASETGRFAVIEDAAHPIGFAADGEPMNVDVEQTAPHDAAVRVTRTVDATAAQSVAHLTMAVGSAAGLWPVLYGRAKIDVKKVKGSVKGATGIAQVVGLDDEGAPQIRVATDVAGRFELDAPAGVTSFYASESALPLCRGRAQTSEGGCATRTSTPVMFAPGTPSELVLDVSDGGELTVHARDADTHLPITARLIVHGVSGTLDPSFGPDYRASGAGPIIDALRGEVTTPLPAGKYRIAATKGIEWSIDTRFVDIEPGKRTSVDLEPRHVVPTPGELGCDLHVHARPSFDAPVTPEDRVLSLVAAGVDFAVPTEHNLVGNYGPSVKLLGLESELMFVPGTEITTFMPKFGHFGLFPYPTDKPPPPYKNTDVARVFASARAGDPKRALIVHHPRLTREIGYFTASGWKPGGPIPIAMRTDFDAIEVFNGYESASIDRVEIVLQDYYALLNAGHRYAATGSSDSHRIQYQWAGYPRTMVRVGATDDDVNRADPLAVVAAIKAGHATVTSGPIVELEIGGARPGGDLVTTSHTLLGRLVVRAAPWVDVTSANVIVGGRVVQTFDVPTRPMTTGPEPGTKEEAAARTVRLDAEVRIDVGATQMPTWVLATARGTRTLDDILPFMPIQPFAITNPIFIRQ
jgi:hypothetical protein